MLIISFCAFYGILTTAQQLQSSPTTFSPLAGSWFVGVRMGRWGCPAGERDAFVLLKCTLPSAGQEEVHLLISVRFKFTFYLHLFGFLDPCGGYDEGPSGWFYPLWRDKIPTWFKPQRHRRVCYESQVSHPSPANSHLHRGKHYIRFLSIFSRLLKYLQNCNKSHSTKIKPPRPSNQFNTDFITYSVICHQQQDETNLWPRNVKCLGEKIFFTWGVCRKKKYSNEL